MATNANLLNSVNWPCVKTKFCDRIFFNLLNLSSKYEKHIYCDTIFIKLFIILSPEPRFQTETWIRAIKVASKFLWSMDPPPNRFVSYLTHRLLTILYFNIYYFLASQCIIMPFWQFYSLESFQTDCKILSLLRSSPARTVLVQPKPHYNTSDFMWKILSPY